MSAQPSSNPATTPTAYQDLHTRYESSNLIVQQESSNTLPESFQTGGQVKTDRREIHELDPLFSEQQAIHQVTATVLNSPKRIRKSRTAPRIPNNCKQHSLGDDSMAPPTRSQKEILNQSVKQGASEERRANPESRMIYFLMNSEQTTLDLSGFGLESVPVCLLEKSFNRRLEELNLSGNNLRSIPKKIDQLRHLKVLHLANNQLQSLPKEIHRLRHLKVLHLANNQLQSLPKKIGKLMRLEGLNLASNQFQSFPREITWLINLKVLYLDNNQLQLLPKEIRRFINLRVLNLAGNQLQSLPKEMVQMEKLRDLRIPRNPFSSFPKNLIMNPELGILHSNNIFVPWV